MAFQIDSTQVADLVEAINQDSKLLATGNARARSSLQENARNLCQALETAQESIMRMWLYEATTKAIIQVGFDLKLFGLLPGDQDKALGSVELAEKTGTEQALLVRLLNHLVASSLINEAGPDRFYANNLTKALASEKIQDGFKYFALVFQPMLTVLPGYLAERGYRDPNDGLDSPAQTAFNTKLHSFEYMKNDPELARLFKSVVLSQDYFRRARWGDPDFYPVRDRLLTGLKEDSVVMVDVGGGAGLDLIDFHERHPERAGGRLVLQDTEQVLNTVDVPAAIEKMPHDFFREQPVKGARAYYFHRVFHDWTNIKCREMLLALKPALIPGYSRVLVQDNVVPAQGASLTQTASDLLMMCGFAGRERFEKDYLDVFESVGMEVTGVWTRVPGEESVVEAMVLE